MRTGQKAKNRSGIARPSKTSMRFLCLLVLGLGLSLAILCAGGRNGGTGKNPARNGRLTIVFMNDTHTHLYPWKDENSGREYGGAARWATLLNQIRREAGEVLFLHSGDMLVGSDNNYLIGKVPNWERLPLYGYRGLLEIPLFEMLGLDAACFGNHEFDYGLYWNYHLFSQASFDLLAANVSLRPVPAGNFYEPSHYKPYQIYQKGNFRIGVIGILTHEFIKTPQIKVGDPAEAVAPLVAQLKKECDVVVVLSHLGVEPDMKLASRVPGIDVIVGGHSHTYLPEPRIVGETIITQTRCYGEFVGRLDLEYKDGVLEDYRYRLLPANFSVPEDPEVKAWLDKWLYPVTLDRPLSSDGQGEASLGEYIAGVMGEQFPCDAALIKLGGFRKELPSGRVSARDFFTALWPYRMRDDGPEKELSPEQVMDIVSGKAPSAARHLLPSAEGLSTLIGTLIPAAALDEIERLNESRAGTEDGFSIRRFSVPFPEDNIRVVMDLPAWIDLYREGILTDDYEYQNLSKEIIEALINY
ncbi:MAG: bifunctional metallophosphatase/5'-nucleotidase [Treponema sp.]|nr:bifunctional metallophosphatase/5'-nucleotidase [Treponema sp.]